MPATKAEPLADGYRAMLFERWSGPTKISTLAKRAKVDQLTILKALGGLPLRELTRLAIMAELDKVTT